MTTSLTSLSFTLAFLIISGIGFAQSIGIKDFEKVPSLNKPVDYFLKKDFAIKSDSSTKSFTKVRLYNRTTREWIYLFTSKGDEVITDVLYLTHSSDEYSKIARSITKSGYSAIGNVRNYEKRLSSYEWNRIVLKEVEYIKEREYYGIGYKYFSGKELSTPSAPADK